MTLKEMKKVIDSDYETKNLGILDVDILKVYQYILDRNNKVNKDGYESVLRTKPYVEIVYLPTKQKAREIKQQRIRQHLKFYDSEIYMQDASLDRFDVSNDEREKAHQLASHFLKNYRKVSYAKGTTIQGHHVKGLYIYGKYATGKSYLLSAIAHHLAEKNVSVLFVYMPDLVRSIRQGMNEGNLEQRINQLKQADVLMVDDIGGENMSPWFRDEILVPIMQYRLSARLPVFMSSNFEYIQLIDTLTVGKDAMNRVKAARLIQRFKDLMVYVKLTKEQYKE